MPYVESYLRAGHQVRVVECEHGVRRPLFAFLGDSQRERADRVGHAVWSRLRIVVEVRPHLPEQHQHR